MERDDLNAAFERLGQLAQAEDKTVEIAVYGGAALMLTYNWRLATKDVDAVFEADKATVKRLASAVAEERGLDENWLNDGVKGFLSARDRNATYLKATFPPEAAPGLRVFFANPAYLFAMKCRAMRLGGLYEPSDVDDIRNLIRELGISNLDQALNMIADFYPNAVIEPKTLFGLEEILQDVSGKPEPLG